jgi:predicted dinucleotide-binding enzyme
MTTAIIGLGNMGKGLAHRLGGKTDLILASREPDTGLAATLGARSMSVDAAIAAADVVILALPYASALEIAGHPGLAGKIVVDISNPVKPDFSGLLLGHTTSAAEEIQARAKGARVVKAWNTIFAQLFARPASETAGVPVYLAGEEQAVERVADLVRKSGFAVEALGALDAARLIEPVGMLNIRLGYGLGRGTSIAPAWLKLAA